MQNIYIVQTFVVQSVGSVLIKSSEGGVDIFHLILEMTKLGTQLVKQGHVSLYHWLSHRGNTSISQHAGETTYARNP